MIRRTASIAAGLVGGLSMLAFIGAPAGAATTVIKVKPNSGLSDGQQVKVKGTGLKANKQLAIVECNSADESEGGCNLSNIGSATSSSTGTFKAKFTVNETYTSTDGPVNCGPGGTQCIVVVAYVKTQKEAGMPVPISFGSGG